MNLHGQIMNIQSSTSYEGYCYKAYAEGHRDARHAAAELACKYDSALGNLDALDEAIHELGNVGSDGWCRGDVHGDTLQGLKVLRDKLKSLKG